MLAFAWLILLPSCLAATTTTTLTCNNVQVPGLPFTLYEYEKYGNVYNSLDNCVGLIGGVYATRHAYQAPVKRFSVYWGCPSGNIQAVTLQYTNGVQELHGTIPTCSTAQSASYTFKPAETLVGEMVLKSNAGITRFGYIAFNTSTGGSFIGGDGTGGQRRMPVDGLLLVGLSGGSGSEVDFFCPWFSYPVVKAVVQGVQYSTPPQVPANPSDVDIQEICNDGATPIQEHVAYQTQVTESSSYSFSSSVSYGMSKTEEVGFEVGVETWVATASVSGSVSATTSVSTAVTSTRDSEVTKQITKTYERTCDVPAMTDCVLTTTRYMAQATLNWNASLVVVYSNAASSTSPVSGTLKTNGMVRELQTFHCANRSTPCSN